MSRILTEFEASKTALRRYLGRFFRRPQDVEDLLQETFVRAYAAEARGPILMPRAYLFRVAKHVSLNEIARRKNSDNPFGRGFRAIRMSLVAVTNPEWSRKWMAGASSPCLQTLSRRSPASAGRCSC